MTCAKGCQLTPPGTGCPSLPRPPRRRAGTHWSPARWRVAGGAATPVSLDGRDEWVGVAAPLGHPFRPPRDEVRQRARVPPERNAATAAALGVAGADAEMRTRSGQANVRQPETTDLGDAEAAATSQAENRSVQPRLARAWGATIQVRQHGGQLMPHEDLRRVQVPGGGRWTARPSAVNLPEAGSSCRTKRGPLVYLRSRLSP